MKSQPSVRKCTEDEWIKLTHKKTGLYTNFYRRNDVRGETPRLQERCKIREDIKSVMFLLPRKTRKTERVRRA